MVLSEMLRKICPLLGKVGGKYGSLKKVVQNMPTFRESWR